MSEELPPESKKFTIFDCLNAILGNGKTPKYAKEKMGVNWEKNPNFLKENEDAKKSFEPYQINRYCSFYDTNLAYLINETTNRYWNLFEQKEDLFSFIAHLYGEYKYLYYKDLNYIKDPTFKVKLTE